MTTQTILISVHIGGTGQTILLVIISCLSLHFTLNILDTDFLLMKLENALEENAGKCEDLRCQSLVCLVVYLQWLLSPVFIKADQY